MWNNAFIQTVENGWVVKEIPEYDGATEHEQIHVFNSFLDMCKFLSERMDNDRQYTLSLK